MNKDRIRSKIFAATLVSVLGLTACAGVPDTISDPYERTNRQVFAMNRRMDRNILKPIAETYVAAIPQPLRIGMHNLLSLADQPKVFANDLLQAGPEAAGKTLLRLIVNATLGVGVCDAASPLGLADHDNDFGKTLAVWGWGDAPYLMVPLIGPSNPRDALGFVGDIVLDPAIWLQYKQYVWWLGGREALEIVDLRANNLTALDDIERTSVDFYAATRSFYRQHRATETDKTMAP
jgi:phospholipid-binding lipoprotein MlaA